MIKINKTQPAPRVLFSRGPRSGQDKCHSETQNACSYFESQNYNPNEKCEYSFDGDIYGNRIWKELLLKDQHNKCCFCEAHFQHITPGDVEHFRPKGGYKQSHSDSLQNPGYYWLAYDWDNLLISCPKCNRMIKQNLFPLINSSDRANKENKDITAEKPILINPWIEDPESFIQYNLHIPFGIDPENRGKQTIELLKLDKDIDEVRSQKLSSVETSIVLLEANTLSSFLPQDYIDKQMNFLVGSLHEKSAYSAMIKCNFADKIKELQQFYQTSI